MATYDIRDHQTDRVIQTNTCTENAHDTLTQHGMPYDRATNHLQALDNGHLVAIHQGGLSITRHTHTNRPTAASNSNPQSSSQTG